MMVSVAQAVELLRKGEVVAVPTETVYGLAGSIFKESALKNIFSTKQRPFFDPLIVHISDLSQLDKVVANFPESAQILAKAFWPGPLTMVLKKDPQLSPLITSGLDSVGVRMPRHPMCLDILQQTGPLAAPSANRFGKTSPTRAEHVEKEFAGAVPVVDGDASTIGIESTVVSVTESAQSVDIFILRPGAITQEDLQKSLVGFAKKVIVGRKTSPVAPGQLENHYQPEKPLVIAENSVQWTTELHQSLCERLQIDVAKKVEHWNFAAESPEMAARSLYSLLREKSENVETAGSYIFLKLPNNYENEPWEAIRDRLNKASSARVRILQGNFSILVKAK